MISWSHVGETAILMTLTYALGCAIGFAAYRLSHHQWRRPARATPEAVDLAAQITARLPPMSAQPAEDVPPSADPALPEAVPAPVVDLLRLSPPDVPVPPAPPPDPTPAPRPGKPKTLAKPRGGVKDDLKAIKGIGPKLEPRLNDLGIFHISQIAGWSRSNADWVSRELGFPGRVEREAWVAQAKVLAPKSKAERG